MEKLYRQSKVLEESFSEITKNLFNNNPGLSKLETTPLDVVAYSVGVLISKLSILRADIASKYKENIKHANNSKCQNSEGRRILPWNSGSIDCQ